EQLPVLPERHRRRQRHGLRPVRPAAEPADDGGGAGGARRRRLRPERPGAQPVPFEDHPPALGRADAGGHGRGARRGRPPRRRPPRRPRRRRRPPNSDPRCDGAPSRPLPRPRRRRGLHRHPPRRPRPLTPPSAPMPSRPLPAFSGAAFLAALALCVFTAVPARAQTPCEGGFAGNYPCEGVDLLANLPLSTFGPADPSCGHDIWGWTDPQSGRDYALVGLTTGTAFVDVPEPTAPVYLGKLPTATDASTWRDIKVYPDHAFVVA